MRPQCCHCIFQAWDGDGLNQASEVTPRPVPRQQAGLSSEPMAGYIVVNLPLLYRPSSNFLRGLRGVQEIREKLVNESPGRLLPRCGHLNNQNVMLALVLAGNVARQRMHCIHPNTGNASGRVYTWRDGPNAANELPGLSSR